ncbi:hypothetical protein [Bernardetia litoralis]|uniref:hypothetical protein n=1 Tax=Bernardetia litoralis TaxID=999 RepID=UPI0002D6D12B|nr:hypothetical protein [Bernardetia litoralis]
MTNSKVLVILLPTVIFVGLFVFFKFFFVLFSDRHQLKVSTPSEKIVSTIRNNIGNKKDFYKDKMTQDSILNGDKFYDSKESYNKKETKKDTTLRRVSK